MSPIPHAGRAAAAATALLTAAALLAVAPATAQPQDTRVPLAGGASAPSGAHRDATVEGGRGVGIAVALRPHDEAGLNRFVSAVGDPRSPGYRHYLTSEQYNARFAPSPADVAQVTGFLRAQGFAVTSVSANRQVVDARGTAAQVKSAFGTSLGDYTGTDGTRFYANDSAPSVPAKLSGLVRSVLGLTDRPVAHRASAPAIRRTPARTGPGGPGGPGGGYTPAQFRTAYSMTKLSGSYTGSGQNVGLVEFDAFKQSDLDGWTQNFGQPSVTPSIVPVDGGVSSPGGNQLEVTLDVEAVAATSPGASQTVYEAANTDAAWVDEMAKIAGDNSITVLSNSWLNGEKCESSPIKASHDSYTQMAAQGITMLSASGDWGATGCGYNGDNSTVQADFPASDPLFTGVGGTQLTTGDSAGTYQAESCWNQGGSGNTRSGGGYSQIFAKPDWQPGTNQFRSVPDVALDADYGAGALSVYMNGGWEDVGGTSLSSPLWAGYIAMANQKAKAGSKSDLGALNPTIYAIAGSSQYASTFHDVTSGDNGTYSAGPGYDLCTGWGSMQGDNLVDPLINGTAPAPADDFSVAASPSSVSVDPGKSVTTGIGTTVTKGAAQDVALSAAGLPAGVTADFSPATVTAGKSSTLTLTAAASAAPGTTTVTVTGKGTGVSHNATVSLTVNGSGTGDFSLSASPASATVVAGQSAKTTVSATAAGGQARAAARPAVVGGDPTTVDQYPFMISMRREGSAFPGQQSCSMALAGPHTVVGAAHCLLEKPGTKWFVYGATNLGDAGFRADIKDSWTDPDYTSWQTGHDVAVITLDKDVPVPAGIQYPTIATDPSVNTPGTMGRGIGWGETGPSTYSDVLRTAEFPVAKDSDCAGQQDLSAYYKSDGSMLCTGYADGHKGVCVGDSGSPFLEGNRIAGFFSWMSNSCNTYGVYSRVSTYADEIKAHLPGAPTSGGIALSASGLPAGATASFSPTSIDAGGSSALTVATSASTPAGTYTITVTGKNSQNTRTATFGLTVQPGSSGPVTVADPGYQFVHGQAVHLQLTATGGTGGYTWSATGLPPGLSIDAKSGLITGTAGTGNFTSPVTATDSAGTSGKVDVNWLVY